MIRHLSRPSLALLGLLAASAATPESATLGKPDSRVRYEELAKLAHSDSWAQLACEVILDKPVLEFDLRFHFDYHIVIPFKSQPDVGGWVNVGMRITSIAGTEPNVYLARQLFIPKLPMGDKRERVFADGFDSGPGRYRVDWIMSDSRARVCSAHWDVEAKAGLSKNLPLTLAPGQVVDRRSPISDAPQIKNNAVAPLKVKILLNLSPAGSEESILKTADAAILSAIVRSITDQPRVTQSALEVFNMLTQRIIYRHKDTNPIDFAALEKARLSPTAGSIDISRLRDPLSETHFLTDLLADQFVSKTGPPDAVVVVGPKLSLDRRIRQASQKAMRAAACPVFYLYYDSNPEEPLSDPLYSAIKAYQGALSYRISTPHDLGIALRDLLSRIGKRPVAESSNSSF